MLDQRFDPQGAEQRIYQRWEEEGCFRPSGDTNAEAYSIVIPPPNVTGVLHMGHALNNTLQDILVRFERMRGKNVRWQPGTDHAGIATQMVVERQLAADGNESRASLGREAFVDRVWEWKEKSGGQIIQQLKRLGASCDWENERFTMGDRDNPDDQMQDAVRKVFVGLYNQGLIYRDKRLVNWDPHFQTAISDLEVEQKEVQGAFWHLRYPLADGVTYEHPITDEDGNPAGTETRDYIVVATTRPETMLGDTGVAVHPDDERYAGLVGKAVIRASESMTFSVASPARLPTWKSLKSCAGVIFTAPEPFSGSACSSATIGMRRFTIGRSMNLPTRPLYRSSSG